MEILKFPMPNGKDYEHAKLFLHFIRNVREKPDTIIKKTADPLANYILFSADDKYKCRYCGCVYVYRKSLILHLKRLHNVRNISKFD